MSLRIIRAVLLCVSLPFIPFIGGGCLSAFAGKSTSDPLSAQTLAESGARLIVSKDESGSILWSDRDVAEAMVLRAMGEGSIDLIVGLRGDPVLDTPHLAARLENAARQSLVEDVVDEFLLDVHDYALGAAPRELIRYRFVPYVRMRLNSQGVEAVMAHPLVRSMNTEGKGPPLLNASIPFIGADTLHDQQIDGSGYVVAIIDTGIYSAHQMFPTNKIVEQACFSTPVNNQDTCSAAGDGEPCESRAGGTCFPYHGTHVAGIAAGASVSACVGTNCNILDDTLQGVAKSAGIISINAISIDNTTANAYSFREGDVIDALNEVYALRSTYDIASVNMSFVLSGVFSDWVGEEACDSDWPGVATAVNALHASGIAVVAGSGNCGTDELKGCGTSGGAPGLIAPPACINNVISVSAVRRDLDSHASYANVADILDLLAPAGNTNSGSISCAEWTDGVWSASHLWEDCEDDYHRGIGTSTAAPHVSGAVALLRDEYGTAATPSTMLELLKETGSTVNLTQGGESYSFPRIDLDSALSPPTAPGSPSFLSLSHECLSIYKLSWSEPSSGTVTEYQVEGSYTDTFDSPWREWFGDQTSILVSVDATTWFRVRACNTVSCSGWTAASGSASPTTQPCP